MPTRSPYQFLAKNWYLHGQKLQKNSSVQGSIFKPLSLSAEGHGGDLKKNMLAEISVLCQV